MRFYYAAAAYQHRYDGVLDIFTQHGKDLLHDSFHHMLEQQSRVLCFNAAEAPHTSICSD